LTPDQVQRILVQPLEAASVFLSQGVRFFDTNGAPVRIPKQASPTSPGFVGENTLIPENTFNMGELAPLHWSFAVLVYRWVQTFTREFIDAARPARHAAGDRWFVDETYVKIAGRWTYLYRAIDQYGQVIDVLVTTRRDAPAARGSSLSRCGSDYRRSRS
jgi:hypothetical protein